MIVMTMIIIEIIQTLPNHIHHISNLDMLPLGTSFKKKLPHNKTNKTKKNQRGHNIHPSLRFGGLYPKRFESFQDMGTCALGSPPSWHPNGNYAMIKVAGLGLIPKPGEVGWFVGWEKCWLQLQLVEFKKRNGDSRKP